MSDLTKDKVERAIAEINPNPPRYGQGIPSPEAAQTALAALDAFDDDHRGIGLTD